MTTLNEIARKAKVSVGTVDRVIHERGRVSEETRKRIQKIILESKYKPNIMARNLSLKKTFMFGALIPQPEQDGHYWELPTSGIRKALDELSVYNVDVAYFTYDKYSGASFRRACDAIRHALVTLDGLLIAPVLSKEAESFISYLPESLPYVFIDSYIPHSSCLSYIGQESYQSGVLAAKLMKLKIRSGKVAVFRVLPVDYHIEDRVCGFQAAFNNDSNFTLYCYHADREHDMMIFRHLAKQLMEEHPDIDGIFIPIATTHQVADYLTKIGKSHEITLIGYDLVEENRKYLKSGAIDFVISQRPMMQGYQGIHLLYRHVVLKEPIDNKVIVPMDIVTKENLDYYQG